MARCPACRNSFCRECVTEHEGRVVCAGCLKKTLRSETQSRHRMRRFLTACLPIGGILLAWLLFYGLGRVLLTIPSEVHDDLGPPESGSQRPAPPPSPVR